MRLDALLVALSVAGIVCSACSPDLSAGCHSNDDCLAPSAPICHSSGLCVRALSEGTDGQADARRGGGDGGRRDDGGGDGGGGAPPDAGDSPVDLGPDARRPDLDASADGAIDPQDGAIDPQDGALRDDADPGCQAEELCDGVDNDCDGEIDEDFPLLGGACRGGVGECMSDGVLICGPDGRELACEPGTPPRAEICDDIDNDCDGEIDEALVVPCYFGPAGTSGVGACQSGEIACVEGMIGACEGQVLPAQEGDGCDGIDEDCDGEVDEGAFEACYSNGLDSPELLHEQTACRTGRRPCGDDDAAPCEAEVLPAEGPDDCNGLDDDCDGLIDEDCHCVEGAPCEGSVVGLCQPGVQHCDGGELVECGGRVEPTEEICNGLDDNCNEAIDEDAETECYEGLDETFDVGECRAGRRPCEDGELGDCLDQVLPAVEICNGLDDDCDSVVDEGFALGELCSVGVGSCAREGIIVCREDGGGATCSAQPAPAEVEICNGADDDCDGAVDEGTDEICYPGPILTQDVGACRSGQRRCIAGVLDPICQGAVVPGAELCDADQVDEDCDGDANEGCECIDGTQIPCGTDVGACQAGARTCQGGAYGACLGAIDPVPEICDREGLDEDCDGEANEGCDCVDGDELPCGTNTGECTAGTLTCRGGAYGPCVGAIGPTPEVCDAESLDEDCDAMRNEGCQCVNGQLRPCGSDVGECRAGSETCVAGRWQACVGAVGPQAERCDGLDQDCDGLPDVPDEGCACVGNETQPCGTGQCVGSWACDQGQWGACDGPPPGPEICDGRMLDENCDGTVDEICDCQLGQVRDCGTGLCAGTQICDILGQWPACDGLPPGEEICDGRMLDENCDGAVDEICDCQQGQVQECGTGLCVGTQTCDILGQWPACDGPPPGLEICDPQLQDEDCDGLVNEGCVCVNGETRACGDPAGCPGFEECVDGQWSGMCLAVIEPLPEICNGEDDDCDGVIDNPGAPDLCTMAQNAVWSCEVGACVYTCDAGWFASGGDPSGGCDRGCAPLGTLGAQVRPTGVIRAAGRPIAAAYSMAGGATWIAYVSPPNSHLTLLDGLGGVAFEDVNNLLPATHPSVAVDENGAVHFVVQRGDPPILEIKVHSPGGNTLAWDLPGSLGAGAPALVAHSAADSNPVGHVAFTLDGPNEGQRDLYRYTYAPGGAAGAPVLVQAGVAGDPVLSARRGGFALAYQAPDRLSVTVKTFSVASRDSIVERSSVTGPLPHPAIGLDGRLLGDELVLAFALDDPAGWSGLYVRGVRVGDSNPNTAFRALGMIQLARPPFAPSVGQGAQGAMILFGDGGISKVAFYNPNGNPPLQGSVAPFGPPGAAVGAPVFARRAFGPRAAWYRDDNIRPGMARGIWSGDLDCQ